MRTSIVSFIALLLGAGSVYAAHPEAYELERIQILAHELEDAARHVYYEAKSARHHYDREESYGLKRLRRLDSRARHFHRQVEKHRQNPYHTRDDYYALRESYYLAAEAIRPLHAVRHVRRDFERVGHLIHRLDGYFSRSFDGRRGYVPGHHDHHRYPDHRRHPTYWFGGWWRW